MVGNSYFPSRSSRAEAALDGAKDRIQDVWDQRKPARAQTVRKAGLLAIVAAAATALLIIPEPDKDPGAEAYALQALAEPELDSESQDVTESTFEVADQPLETNEPESWSASDIQATATYELTMFRQRTETTAPPTTEAPTTAAPTTRPPTTKAPATTTAAAPTSESDPETTGASETETSTGDESSETTETSETTVEETATTVEETTTAPPTTAAGNGFVDAGHGVYVPPILIEIRRCESTHNYQAANPYSSARGAYQFLTGSWAAYGHADRYGVSQAHLATNAQQDEAALITWQRDGTRPWNASRHCWG